MNLKRFGFIPWMVFFLFSLSLITVLLLLSLHTVAKAMGILITVTLVVLMRYWLYQLKKSQSVTRVSLNANDKHELITLIPWFSALKDEEKNQLIHRLGLQMGALTIHNPESISIDHRSAKSMALLFALLCLQEFPEKEQTPSCTVVLRSEGDFMKDAGTIEVTLEGAKDRIKGMSPQDLAFFQKR